ncbi:nSTAND3 domain-containing NTPase [Elizabethkingia occulta]|uniref:nSTAND3 domain-containing NTPase n=2 Tax=Weeksellaceae TaxID=2762318 RepID=UPI0012FE4BF3
MNQNIPQLATIKIMCNGEIGTAVLYFPDADLDYVYVLTAKHCLTGKDFNKEFITTDIKLEKIFNEETLTFHSYNLTENDIVNVSENEEDIALLILLKKDIIPLTGKQFFCQVIDTEDSILDYQIRGFANFNNQEADRPFPMKFIEDDKSNTNRFILQTKKPLDTYYQQALENVEGLSGSGAYSLLYGNIYFTGIIHTYEDSGVFIVTKILAYNKIIPPKFSLINSIYAETNQEVLTSFEEIEKNEKRVNARTREKIGDYNVLRDDAGLLKLIQDNNIVVVHGNPGVGKSALTKSTVANLKAAGDYTILTFTPENLYCDTLSEALKSSRCKVDIQQLLSSPLSNKYFLIWIESFEKLIESDISGAFNEMLELISKNPNITVILTIRDYLLQKFRINYYYELPENTSYFQVNEFSDQEMELIRENIPDINPLLENPKVNHLLRTPYYMDKAVRIIPQLLDEQKLDELKFKKLMWQHIVENNQTKRGTVFYEICLKRSREMSLFTTYDGDETITADLVRDNILQLDDLSDAGALSPSHDILEDWALIRFIRHQKLEITNSKKFLLSIENTPAMRRAFRLWMEEFYEYEQEASVYFMHELLNDETLSQSWKDELLIVSLRSNHSKVLLDSLKVHLFEDGATLLNRIIYLLQTGCKKIDPKKRNFDDLLPVGSGWDYIIDFIKVNINEVKQLPSFELKYLNVIESWSKQLSEFNQGILPAGAKSAAFLLEDFIFRLQARSVQRRLGRRSSEYLKKYIEILFKLTEADQELIASIIQACVSPETGNERWTNPAFLREIRAYITGGVISDQICRFFPEEVIQIATEDWAKKEEKYTSGSINSMLIREPKVNDFGLNKDLEYDYGLPSGYQTFFYWMFLYHGEKALDFLISFLNTAFEKNYEILLSLNKREVECINIVFEDGLNVRYYGNYEYWSMYRGFSIYDKVLISSLMALEKTLLEIGDRKDFTIARTFLGRLIRESNNVAVLGVVSSILQAFPNLVDETSVSMLGVPLFFKWDSTRSTSDMIRNHVYNDDEVERKERIASNGRIHRNKYYIGLVGFVADYMFYQRDFNELLYKQVDKMWENVKEDDWLFKKFLFDMDARKYEFKHFDQNGNYVQIVPGYDNTIRNLVESGTNYTIPTANTTWARNAFDYKEVADYNYETWKKGYEFILKLDGEREIMVSPGTMASIALRDFSDQLQPEEIIWCCETIINLEEEKLSNKDSYAINLDLLDNIAPLKGLCYIFKANIDQILKLKVKELVFRLLLKGLDERERIALQHAVIHDLALVEPAFVLNCWYGLAKAVEILQEQNKEVERNRMLYHQGKLSVGELHKSDENNWSELLINSVVNGNIDLPEEIIVSLDLHTQWYLDDMLRIIPWNTTLPAHHKFIQDVLTLHISFLNNPKSSMLDFYESRHAFTFYYPRYLLNQPTELSIPLFKQLLDVIVETSEKSIFDEYLKFIYKLVEEFIRTTIDRIQLENFWIFWEFLEKWMISNRNAIFLPVFLFDINWVESSEKWSVLEGKSLYFKNFITTLGFNRINSSIKFLSGIAFNNFMPDSISWIVPMLQSQNAEQVDNNILEKLIEKAFYRYGGKIKRDKNILSDFLFILDFLVRRSSPKAYMLREELLQFK